MKIEHSKLNKIGGITIFTEQGAIEAYKRFAKLTYNNLSIESSCILSDEAEKMHELGFTWEQIEKLEFEALAK